MFVTNEAPQSRNYPLSCCPVLCFAVFFVQKLKAVEFVRRFFQSSFLGQVQSSSREEPQKKKEVRLHRSTGHVATIPLANP